MKTYLFEARTGDGKYVTGELDARSYAEAHVKIRLHRMRPNTVTLKSSGSTYIEADSERYPLRGANVQPKDLQVFTRQFAAMVKSGIPVVESLDALSEQAGNAELKNIIRAVSVDVRNGMQLYEAVAKYPQVFDRLYVSLVRAGEDGGVLDLVLERLASYIEKSVKLRGKVMGALYYPAAILIIATIVTTAVMTYMIPAFVDIFKSNNLELPWITQLVVEISDNFVAYWYIYIGLVIGTLFFVKVFYSSQTGRQAIDSYLLDTPILGPLIQKSAAAHVSHTMAMLLSSGVRILDALEMASYTAGNHVIETGVQEATVSLSRGDTLSDSLSRQRGMPDMMIQMIRVGEQTGNLDLMFQKASDYYESDVENTISGAIKLIDPILVVVLGGIIGVVVIAMYLPIFKAASIAL